MIEGNLRRFGLLPHNLATTLIRYARLHEDFAQGKVWSGLQVQAWVLAEYGKKVHLARSYEFMRAAGFSPQNPRPKHVKGDEQAKENFKTKS